MHNFLLQVWEAIYREMLKAYCSQETTCTTNIIADAKCILSSGITELMKRIGELITDAEMESKFKEFIKQQSSRDETWKFWTQFVLNNCFSYVGLYLAIREGNWNL